MANLKKIKNKIKSVQNLKKITRALEVVSTVKLQKTKDKADSLKKYLLDLLFILQKVGGRYHLFNENKCESVKRLAIVVTSERGLCGSLNSKLTRSTYTECKEMKSNTDVFVVGKKGLDFFSRAGFNIVGINHSTDNIKDEDLSSLFAFLNKAMSENTYGEIKIYFNYFKNSLIQIPTALQLFPLSQEQFDKFIEDVGISYDIESKGTTKELIIEPNMDSLVLEIRRQLRNYLIYSALIQNKAGEHASRMIAMKNAKDNSTKLITSLVLGFNKIRQASITQEISEIVSAKIAIEG